MFTFYTYNFSLFLIKRRFLTYFLCKIGYIVFSETRSRPPTIPLRLVPTQKSRGRESRPPRLTLMKQSLLSALMTPSYLLSVLSALHGCLDFRRLHASYMSCNICSSFAVVRMTY